MVKEAFIIVIGCSNRRAAFENLRQNKKEHGTSFSPGSKLEHTNSFHCSIPTDEMLNKKQESKM
jgi:hypothetical protein